MCIRFHVDTFNKQCPAEVGYPDGLHGRCPPLCFLLQMLLLASQAIRGTGHSLSHYVSFLLARTQAAHAAVPHTGSYTNLLPTATEHIDPGRHEAHVSSKYHEQRRYNRRLHTTVDSQHDEDTYFEPNAHNVKQMAAMHDDQQQQQQVKQDSHIELQPMSEVQQQQFQQQEHVSQNQQQQLSAHDALTQNGTHTSDSAVSLPSVAINLQPATSLKYEEELSAEAYLELLRQASRPQITVTKSKYIRSQPESSHSSTVQRSRELTAIRVAAIAAAEVRATPVAPDAPRLEFLLAKARRLLTEASAEPPWMRGYAMPLHRWSTLLTAAERMVSRVAALEGMMEDTDVQIAALEHYKDILATYDILFAQVAACLAELSICLLDLLQPENKRTTEWQWQQQHATAVELHRMEKEAVSHVERPDPQHAAGSQVHGVHQTPGVHQTLQRVIEQQEDSSADDYHREQQCINIQHAEFPPTYTQLSQHQVTQCLAAPVTADPAVEAAVIHAAVEHLEHEDASPPSSACSSAVDTVWDEARRILRREIHFAMTRYWTKVRGASKANPIKVARAAQVRRK